MRIILILSVVFLTSGCATLLKGYFSELEIKNARQKLKIADEKDIEIAIKREYAFKYKLVYDSLESHSQIQRDTLGIISTHALLRSDKDYCLTFTYAAEQQKMIVYKKISFWWAFFDVLCGGFPVFIDAYTGAWHYYDPVVLGEQKK